MNYIMNVLDDILGNVGNVVNYITVIMDCTMTTIKYITSIMDYMSDTWILLSVS